VRIEYRGAVGWETYKVSLWDWHLLTIHCLVPNGIHIVIWRVVHGVSLEVGIFWRSWANLEWEEKRRRAYTVISSVFRKKIVSEKGDIRSWIGERTKSISSIEAQCDFSLKNLQGWCAVTCSRLEPSRIECLGTKTQERCIN
jgi:hypothetical protein